MITEYGGIFIYRTSSSVCLKGKSIRYFFGCFSKINHYLEMRECPMKQKERGRGEGKQIPIFRDITSFSTAIYLSFRRVQMALHVDSEETNGKINFASRNFSPKGETRVSTREEATKDREHSLKKKPS